MRAVLGFDATALAVRARVPAAALRTLLGRGAAVLAVRARVLPVGWAGAAFVDRRCPRLACAGSGRWLAHGVCGCLGHDDASACARCLRFARPRGLGFDYTGCLSFACAGACAASRSRTAGRRRVVIWSLCVCAALLRLQLNPRSWPCSGSWVVGVAAGAALVVEVCGWDEFGPTVGADSDGPLVLVDEPVVVAA